MSTQIDDRLDVLIALSAKDCGNDDVDMFNSLDTSNVVLDKSFYAKQRRIINKYKHKPTVTVLKKCFVRVAIALMILMSMGFMTVMAVAELREAVFEAIVEWYDNYISIRFEPTDKDSNEGTDTTLPGATDEPDNSHTEVTPPPKIEKVMKPTYIHEAWEEDIVMNSKSMVIIDYYIGDDVVLSFIQAPFNDKDKLFDNNADVSYTVDVNGYIAVILEYESSGQSIIWTDGVYCYHAHSDKLDINELMKVASSVY